MTIFIIAIVLLAFLAQISFVVQPRDVRPDPVLSRISLELGVGGGFAHEVIAPISNVEADSFRYGTWSREELQNFHKASRTPGVGASFIDFAKTFTPGMVKYYSLNNRIPDEARGNDPDQTSLEARRTKILSHALNLGIEQRIFDLISAATRTQTAPTIKWGAVATAVPLVDILLARDNFRLFSGFMPTHIIIPPKVMRALKAVTSINDLLKHTHSDVLAKGSITSGDMIENMVVVEPGALTDSSDPGASASIADIWDLDEVYFVFVDPSAGSDLSAPTSLRQIRSQATTVPFGARKWRDPDVSANADIVNVQVNQDEVLMSNELVMTLLDVL